jgi:hypothetical protein
MDDVSTARNTVASPAAALPRPTHPKLRVLDLFSGIGGMSLGLERAGGFETVAFCEIEEYPRRVLKKHWPKVPCFTNIRTIARQKWTGSRAQTALRQAFRARTFHSLERVPDLPESVQVYGGRFAEPFAWYDRPSRCWRTWQRCLIEGWERYSEAWPRSGMTRNGIAYRLPTFAHPISATEYGSWPTPRCGDGMSHPIRKPENIKGNGRGRLEDVVSLRNWPTPTAVTATGGLALCKWGGAGSREKLRKMISPEELNGALNPRWVEWLMGYPTGWVNSTDSETPSSPTFQNLSGEP